MRGRSSRRCRRSIDADLAAYRAPDRTPPYRRSRIAASQIAMDGSARRSARWLRHGARPARRAASPSEQLCASRWRLGCTSSRRRRPRPDSCTPSTTPLSRLLPPSAAMHTHNAASPVFSDLWATSRASGASGASSRRLVRGGTGYAGQAAMKFAAEMLQRLGINTCGARASPDRFLEAWCARPVGHRFAIAASGQPAPQINPAPRIRPVGHRAGGGRSPGIVVAHRQPHRHADRARAGRGRGGRSDVALRRGRPLRPPPRARA